MMAERTYCDYLEDILDAMQKIRVFVRGMDYEQFRQGGFAGSGAFSAIGHPPPSATRYPTSDTRLLTQLFCRLGSARAQDPALAPSIRSPWQWTVVLFRI